MVCDQELAGKSEALQHYMESHLKVRYLCDMCQSHFSRSDDLKEHEQTCTLIHQLTSPIKSERIQSKKCATNEIVSSTPDSRTILAKFNEKMCAICQKEFKTINAIHHHLELVHDVKTWLCERCDVGHGYLHYKSLRTHYEMHYAENDSDGSENVSSKRQRQMVQKNYRN